MKLPVNWSKIAKEDFANLLEEIETQFGLDAALSMMDKVEELLEQIATFPSMYPPSNKYPTNRKAVISKQTSLIYQVESQEITLLLFWDNRQNPETLENLF